MSRRILIIEDDKNINDMISSFLRQNGFETLSALDGASASTLLKQQDYSLVLTDLMLPEKSGEDLISELRSYSDIPVIVLSAKSMLETRLEVLRLGADDYILKPFDLNEVLVRIQVVLRRSAAQSAKEVLSCGELRLSPSEHTVTFQGKAIPLTAKELMLLQLLMEYPSKVFSKANLYESVWNEDYFIEDNTINVHVSNLRSKLKKATGADYIETVWGIGYRFKEN
ncbi:MAG: response regulator transcription factor [Oscillospiraceae bacterium]